jgi:flavin-dependent dehydrogenase
MATLHEPARDIPVIHEADVCVLGGSCTGLFAAVRAARLGARVAIVEKDNCFGGIATTALVNVWHSLWDTEGKRQIIAGLTGEVIDRLDRRGALWRNKITNPPRLHLQLRRTQDRAGRTRARGRAQNLFSHPVRRPRPAGRKRPPPRRVRRK